MKYIGHANFPALKKSAIKLAALDGIINTNIFIYITALFLSIYPTTWIPYFLIAQAIIHVTGSFLIVPILNRNITRTSLIIQIGSVILTLVLALFLTHQLYYFPLIYSLLLNLISATAGLVTSTCIRNSFDLLEYKQISPAIPIASISSKIVIGLINSLLIKKFGINYLPHFTAFFLLLSCVYILHLRPLPRGISTKKIRFPMRYPIFVNLFLYSFIIAFAYTLVDYTLKRSLSLNYNSTQLGEFLAYFTAISYSFSTIVTYLFSKKLIRLGISSLLGVLPVYWVVMPLIVIFFPTLWPIVLMGAGDYVFYNFIHIGRGLLFNVLPSQLRIVAQTATQIMAESIAIGAASLALILFQSYLSVARIATAIIILNLSLFLVSRRLKTNYIATLKEEIFLKRFSMEDNDISPYQQVIETAIVQELSMSDPKAIRYGYSLLATSHVSKFPGVVLQHINHEESDIRIEAIKSVVLFKQKSAVPLLLDLMQREKNLDVKWWIINALAEFYPNKYISEAHAWLQDPTAEISSAAIRILINSTDVADVKEAIAKLQLFLKSAQSVRRIAARILPKIPVIKIKNIFSDFIHDPDDIVSSYAIEAVYAQKEFAFTEDVIRRMTYGGVYHSARHLIHELSEQAIAQIMQIMAENKDNQPMRCGILVTALAELPHTKAEQALIEIAEQKVTVLRQAAAIALMHRAQHFRRSEAMKEKSLQFIHEEAELMVGLLRAAKKYTALPILSEIHSRSELAFVRYFAWLSVYNPAKEIFNLIPNILSDDKLERSKAIELLSSMLPRKIANLTLAIFAGEDIHQHIHIATSLESYFDPWLLKVINTAESHEASMNNIQKVFVLRQINLFNSLPAETLMVIAEEAEVIPMSEKQVIFAEGDAPNGLYIIASGRVNIIRQNQLLTELHENDFFGELALLDNEPRAATALAANEGTLLFLRSEAFEHISNDLPQVLRSVMQAILRYLRSNLAQQSKS